VDARRETNGITSRLLLLYVDEVGGPEAVDRVLARCGMSDRRGDLLDENYWFSYDGKIALFEAASEELEDPNVMLNVASHALAPTPSSAAAIRWSSSTWARATRSSAIRT
jgi:hypothetical protein